MCCNHIVKATACARDLSAGEDVWVLLEASNSSCIVDAMLLRQRAPRKNCDQRLDTMPSLYHIPFATKLEFVESTARRTMFQGLKNVPIVLMLPLYDLLRRGSLRTIEIQVRIAGSEADEKETQYIHEWFHRDSGSAFWLKEGVEALCSATYRPFNLDVRRGKISSHFIPFRVPIRLMTLTGFNLLDTPHRIPFTRCPSQDEGSLTHRSAELGTRTSY